MSRISAIRPLGQSIWLDNLSRELLQSGALARLLQEDQIAGVTSNPSIFFQAIRSDPHYQAPLAALKKRTDLNAEQRFEWLVLEDIQEACDILRPLYERSHQDNGYVSFEVSPSLAHNEEGTLQAARRLWHTINRPNAMIKIPATTSGIRAFEQLTYEGINVNITLLFSLPQVYATWDAYIAGLRRRLTAQQPLQAVKAVASLFISRLDNRLDPLLSTKQQGTSAISLAKAAYARYLTRFHGTEFSELNAAGAKPQYLLWASTSAKNPQYRDVMYVEELIGPETINTVPEHTLNAFRDHGEAMLTLPQGGDEALMHLQQLGAEGINLTTIGEDLQEAGLKQFQQAFDELLTLML